MNEIELTVENFEKEVINSELPVMVDFWAAWCGPCRMLAPTVEEIANEYAGKIKVGKVNVDEQMDLAIKYNTVSIPTVIFFKDGKVVNTLIGLRDKSEFTDFIKTL